MRKLKQLVLILFCCLLVIFSASCDRLFPILRIMGYGSYTVVFDGNGGSGSMPDQEISRNESTRLSTNMFSRTQYYFVGWNTSADGDNILYYDRQKVYNLAENNETVTLYAQWEYIEDEYIARETYAVRYVDRYGTTISQNTMDVGVDYIIYCTAYQTPESHIFIGWNTKADGTGTSYKNGDVLSNVKAGQTVVLYAQYKRIENAPMGGSYYIDDYTDLLLMKNDLNGTYILTKDIDMSNIMVVNAYECGTPGNPFNGKFFGNGHVIYGSASPCSYTKEIYCGLFGYISKNGWVQDLHLELWIDSWDYSAPFARYNEGTIINCSATGWLITMENEFLRKDLYVGGIVVFNSGTIKNTLSTASIGATSHAKKVRMGGICAENSGIVENCIYLSDNYTTIGGYKYNKYTSFQIDGLMCVNKGTSTNNYYFNDISYEIKKGLYEGEYVDEIYESGKIASPYGAGAAVS